MAQPVQKNGLFDSIFRRIRTAYKHPYSKEVRIFLVFFLLSFFFWWLQSLQEPSETELRIPIHYNELPNNLSITNTLPKYLTVTLGDKGTILYEYIRDRKELSIQLNLLDFYKNSDFSEVTFSDLERKFRLKLKSTTNIVRIKPERIQLAFCKGLPVKLPVKLRTDIAFSPQHQLSGEPKVVPTHVLVFAPESKVKQLEYIETESLIIPDLGDTLTTDIALKPIVGVRFAQTKVQVSIPVEEYTEKTLQIPVMGLNFPPNTALLAFPQQVRVTFFVGLSAYKRIQAGDFKLGVDYQELLQSKNSNGIVRVIQNPKNVTNIRITPSTVECIVEKTKQ